MIEDYFEFATDLQPPYLLGEAGEGWALIWGHLADAFAEGAKEAVRARYPDRGAPDALQAQASDRDTERYPGEAPEGLRRRLREAFEEAHERGTPAGLVAALEAAPGVIEVRYVEAWQVDPSVFWARWWAVVRVSWPVTPGWDAPGLTWDAPGLTWDFLGGEEGAFLLRQARRYRAAHCRAWLVVVSPEAALWDEPGLVWDAPGLVWDAGHSALIEVRG